MHDVGITSLFSLKEQKLTDCSVRHGGRVVVILVWNCSHIHSSVWSVVVQYSSDYAH